MEQITDNMQKYTNYKEQMSRLKKALNAQFYLEAIFIEYAILEDRLESALRHSGRFNMNNRMSIEKKCKNVLKLTEEKKGFAKKYFTEDLINSILQWKENRNKLIHALMKQSLHTEDLQSLAEDGSILIKAINNKVSLYNRAVDKANQKK